MHRRAGFTSAELLNLVVLAAILAAIILGRQRKPGQGDAAPAPATTTQPAASLPSRCTAITPLDSIRIAADTACRQVPASPPSADTVR